MKELHSATHQFGTQCSVSWPFSALWSQGQKIYFVPAIKLSFYISQDQNFWLRDCQQQKAKLLIQGWGTALNKLYVFLRGFFFAPYYIQHRNDKSLTRLYLHFWFILWEHTTARCQASCLVLQCLSILCLSDRLSISLGSIITNFEEKIMCSPVRH